MQRIENTCAEGMQSMVMTEPASAKESSEASGQKVDSSGPQNLAVEMEVDHEGNTVFVRGTLIPESVYHPVVLVPDFGETGTLYREATREFNERGFSAVSFDMRGHGRSGKRLGHFEDYQTLVQDLLQVAAWLRHKSNGLAPIVIAQGLSTAIGIHFMLRFPKMCHRLVLASPVFKMKNGLSKPATLIIKTLADIFPFAKVPASLTPQMLSSIKFGTPEMIHQERPEIPLSYSTTYVRELLELMDTAPGRFLRIKAPTLIIRNSEDEISDYEVLNELLKRHKRRQFIKEIIVDERTHNLLTENNATLQSTLNIIQAWLAQIEQENNEQAN